ncbi:uncharacterized protein LOC116924337 isoform X2 [Daphnia magna]|uniref:N-acetyltransferase protein NAT1 n=1 Tax=Daphnia magna TaxID=35525 RepID=A0A162CAL4_9CRUS|nr:uncharacterized protein LOC116924337 isoform X2 [Daphnia magna]KZS02951.1 N-acetyltransferase protein NAT1 [Daphnia magna]
MPESVTLASRSDLLCLLPFLDSQLSERCEIQLVVFGALRASTSAYLVYILRETPTDGSYTAIAAIKRENMKNETQENQTIWIVSGWSINESALLRLYSAIDVINWDKDAVFAFNKCYNPHEDILKFFRDRNRLEGHRLYSAGRYVFDIEKALKLQISLPDEVYVKSLERHHAQLIYDHWTVFKDTTTVEDVADEIDHLPSAGVFLKNNDQLVSWMTGHAANGMSRLFTMDGHRRKGYAKLATQYMSKRMAQAGYLPFINIVVGNTASTEFFLGLGFQFVYPMHAILTKPPGRY